MPQPFPRSDFAAALAFARDLIRLPSPSGGEEAVARRVERELRALAFEDVRIDGWGNVIGRIRGTDAQAPTVMLSSHLDVVDAGDEDAWEHPPYAAVVEGGFLHGRGAMDIKGPLALQTYAAAALKGTAPGDVVIAHTVYEERGGLGMAELMESGEVRPDVVVIGESTRGDVCIGHRGRAEVEVVLRGVAGHASAPERARNALDLLPEVLRRLERLAADQPSDPVLGAATLAVTGVETRPASRNVIPDEVVVVLDWRVLPDQDEAHCVGRVRRALEGAAEAATGPSGAADPPDRSVEVRMADRRQTTWTGRTRSRHLRTPGFLTPPDHPLAVAAAKAVGRRDAPDRAAEIRPWTFATDGGWTSGVHGIPTLGFAPGEERHAHTNRERLDLAEARWALERMPGLISELMLRATFQ